MAAVCIFDGKERNHAKAREVSVFLIILTQGIPELLLLGTSETRSTYKSP